MNQENSKISADRFNGWEIVLVLMLVAAVGLAIPWFLIPYLIVCLFLLLGNFIERNT